MRRRSTRLTSCEAAKLSRAAMRAATTRRTMPAASRGHATCGTATPATSEDATRAMTQTSATLPTRPTHCQATVASTCRRASGTSARSRLSIMLGILRFYMRREALLA